jgi:hypothetical protein
MTFILLRIISLILGLLSLYFCYNIYQDTKGGSNRGWLFMSIAGIALSIWASIQTIIVLLLKILPSPNLLLIKIISSLIAYPIIALFVPFAVITINNIFGFKMPNFFNNKKIIILFLLLLVFLLATNISTNWTYIQALKELTGIAHLLLALMFLVTLYPAFVLWEKTKVWVWLTFFLFILFISISELIGTYVAGCCNDHGLNLEQYCQAMIFDSAEVLPLTCTPSAISPLISYQAITSIGVLLGTLSFFGIYQKLKN